MAAASGLKMHHSAVLTSSNLAAVGSMAGQPTPPGPRTPPEIRPYDQGLLTIGFPYIIRPY